MVNSPNGDVGFSLYLERANLSVLSLLSSPRVETAIVLLECLAISAAREGTRSHAETPDILHQRHLGYDYIDHGLRG